MRKKSNAEARESSLASGWVVEGDESASPARDESVAEPVEHPADSENDPGADAGADEPAAQVSNAVLVLLGVFGGLYALFTWGWFVVAKAYADFNTTVAAGSGSFGQVLQQILFWAAPFATVLWFLSATLFLRRRPLWLGIALVLGAVLLVPLPMLVVSAQ